MTPVLLVLLSAAARVLPSAARNRALGDDAVLDGHEGHAVIHEPGPAARAGHPGLRRRRNPENMVEWDGPGQVPCGAQFHGEAMVGCNQGGHYIRDFLSIARKAGK